MGCICRTSTAKMPTSARSFLWVRIRLGRCISTLRPSTYQQHRIHRNYDARLHGFGNSAHADLGGFRRGEGRQRQPRRQPRLSPAVELPLHVLSGASSGGQRYFATPKLLSVPLFQHWRDANDWNRQPRLIERSTVESPPHNRAWQRGPDA